MDKNFDLLYLENWMGILYNKIKDKKLIHLTIPGSHDSNTYTVVNSMMAKKFAKCQAINVYEQLKLGIRYLDLRFGVLEDQIIDQHGPFEGGLFEKNLQLIKEFLDKHPEEFLIINFQNESKIESKYQKEFIKMVLKYLEKYLITEEDKKTWFNIESVTLEMVRMHKKNIFAFLSSYIRESGVFSDNYLKNKGIHDQGESIDSKWHDVNNAVKLIRSNEENLKNKKNVTNKFFCSQFVLTFQRDPENIIKNIVSFTSPDNYKFVEKLFNTGLLQKCIVENLKNFNLVLLDQIDFDLEILKILICSNYKSKMELLYFYIGEFDFTKNLKEKIDKNKFLYFPKFDNIFKKYKPTFQQILVIYKFNDSQRVQVKLSKPSDKSFLIFDNPLSYSKNVNKIISINFYKTKILKQVFIHHESRDQCFDISFKNQDVSKVILIDNNQVIIQTRKEYYNNQK
jgi:hypothetical protein